MSFQNSVFRFLVVGPVSKYSWFQYPDKKNFHFQIMISMIKITSP